MGSSTQYTVFAIGRDRRAQRYITRLLPASEYTCFPSCSLPAKGSSHGGFGRSCILWNPADCQGIEKFFSLSRNRFPEVPVIVLMGRDQQHFEVDFFSAGAFACLTKPVSRIRLTTALHQAVQFSETSRLNNRILEQSRRMKDELSTIHEISREINSELNIDRLLTTIIGHIQTIMDVEIVSCMLHDPEKNELILSEFSGLPDTVSRGLRVPDDQGISGYVFQSREPLLVNDVRRDKRFFKERSGTEYSTQSLVCVPLVSKSGIIGVVNANNKNNGNPFTRNDLSLLTTIAGQAAIAIENARLYSSLEQKQRELQLLSTEREKLLKTIQEFNQELEIKVDQATKELSETYRKLEFREQELNEKILEFLSMKEVGEAVSSFPDLDLVLNLILNLALGHIKAEQGSVMLLSDDEQHLTIRVACGLNDDIIGTTVIPLGTAVAGYVAESGKPLLIVDVEKHPLTKKSRSDLKYKNKSLICVPLIVNRKTIGVINVNNKIDGSVFTEKDLEILSTFALQASLALEKAELYRDKALSENLRVMSEKYLSSALVQKLIDQEITVELGGKVQEVTVLVLDIRGFSALAEKLPAPEMVTILNSLLGAMTEILFRYDGTLDKYTGDGLMAIFGAPMIQEDDCRRAILAAFDMIREVKLHFSSVPGLDNRSLHVGIGINTGQAVTGNIGSEKRMEYTVIGDAVNIAHRLEKYAGPQEIVVSDHTYHRVEDVADYYLMGDLTLKGRSEQVGYYIIRPRNGREGGHSW